LAILAQAQSVAVSLAADSQGGGQASPVQVQKSAAWTYALLGLVENPKAIISL
jgi:hypothetical protein